MTRTTTTRKKLIEVALPLEEVNKASLREGYIYRGNPSALHKWWAQRPLAAARAVIFAQMVDDPSANPDLFPTEKAQQKERTRLFRIIDDLVQWENTINEEVLKRAREEIWQSWRRTCAQNADHPRANELYDRNVLPAFHDPFAGGGSLPLEAQRLGLVSYASDLNPVAVLINKAVIEIPPKFGGKPPVNPDSRGDRDMFAREGNGTQGLAEDVRYYGKWMRDESDKRIGHLYARQLHDQSDLPAGTFETMFSFAQVLTESAKAAKNCLLVVSLPASDTGGSPHTQADDVEVGGVRGREALDRLSNVIGRVESAWRPATAQEGFEIVRRRLFEPMPGDQFKNRDLTARAFSELYNSQAAEFPPECRTADYEKRIKEAYPIHPEVFERLYSDWSTLVKFQRTRGVLRLMASVIHCLWEKGDRNPLILPSTIPIDDARVQFELTRYLSDAWAPIIEKDIDGPNSLPLRIDSEQPNLGRLHATRRVARTVYLGSAPTTGAAHRGLEDRRVTLGCVMPGEPPAVFGDALRRLAGTATYLYQDGARVWYATQPTVTKLADDRAEQLKREPDKIYSELDERIRDDAKKAGDFARVHTFVRSGADVPDDHDARLIVLPAEHTFTKDGTSAAEVAARALLESRGNSPRLFRNSLVFLAADKARMQDLDEAVRRYLAWKSIVNEADTLDLGNQQRSQAATQLKTAEGIVLSRIPETYQWLLVPLQANPQAAVTFEPTRLSGGDALAVRASKKLKSGDLLVTSLGPTILRKHLDDVPLWPDGHVLIRQLVDYFATYIYLPRLAGSDVLVSAIKAGLALMTWPAESFALADSYDESARKYRGLRAGQNFAVTADSSGLLVKPDIARQQIDPEAQSAGPVGQGRTVVGGGRGGTATPTGAGSTTEAVPVVRRYFGTVTLDPTRVGRDAGRIAEEVIAHLVGQVGADVTVRLEIVADLPSGASDQVVRTVTENGRTLKFETHGFERE